MRQRERVRVYCRGDRQRRPRDRNGAEELKGGVTTTVWQAAVVPHDQNDESLNDVLAQAAAGAATLQSAVDGGASLPPPGLHEHGLSEELGPKQ